MTMTKTKVAGALAGSVLVVGGLPLAAVATPSEVPVQKTQDVSTTQTAIKGVETVVGTFVWNQNANTTESLSQRVYEATKYLCGNMAMECIAATGVAQLGSSIEVGGDVSYAFTADVAALEKQAPISKVMGCTCSGNQVDGRATGNASVSGFELAALIKIAQPAEDANTISFTCADGYKIALPLSYVQQRYSIIVTNVNGESAKDAIGCTNQLWLGATAARSFARDIVAIDITAEDCPPEVPGAPAAPGVSVLEGRSI